MRCLLDICVCLPRRRTVHPHMHPCSAPDPSTSGVNDDIWGFLMVGAAMVCQHHPHGLLWAEFERSVFNAQLADHHSGAGNA